MKWSEDFSSISRNGQIFCPFREMDSWIVQFMKWTISLSISRNGQFHIWVITYILHKLVCYSYFKYYISTSKYVLSLQNQYTNCTVRQNAPKPCDLQTFDVMFLASTTTQYISLHRKTRPLPQHLSPAWNQ